MAASGARIDAEQGGGYPEDLYTPTAVATGVPRLSQVRDGDVERYREEGYLVVDQAIDDGLVSAAVDGLMAVLLDPGDIMVEFESWAAPKLDALDGPARLDAVRKFMRFTEREARLQAVAYDEGLLRVVRRLLGAEDIVMMQDMALLKPPGGGREKPWHQDQAYFTLTVDSPVVGVWIALDPATPDNGCMHVIPASHRQGPVVHFRRRDWQICDTDVDRSHDVVVPLQPGGALFFDGLLHHGTPANRSDTRRRALQFHYTPRTVTHVGAEEHLAVFGSEGKDVSC